MWSACNTVMLLLLCIEHSLVVCTHPTCSTREPTCTHIQVMAVVSTSSVYESDNIQQLLPDWQKGEEILPGAHLAAKEVNNVPNLLSGHQFKVIPIRVQCDLVEGMVPFIEALTSNHNIVAIVGYFCPNLAQYLSTLAHYWTASII